MADDGNQRNPRRWNPPDEGANWYFGLPPINQRLPRVRNPINIPPQFAYEVLEDPNSSGDLLDKYSESKVRFANVILDAREAGITPEEYMRRYLAGDRAIVDRVRNLQIKAHEHWLDRTSADANMTPEELFRYILNELRKRQQQQQQQQQPQQQPQQQQQQQPQQQQQQNPKAPAPKRQQQRPVAKIGRSRMRATAPSFEPEGSAPAPKRARKDDDSSASGKGMSGSGYWEDMWRGDPSKAFSGSGLESSSNAIKFSSSLVNSRSEKGKRRIYL